jgi:uncharacterized protein
LAAFFSAYFFSPPAQQHLPAVQQPFASFLAMGPQHALASSQQAAPTLQQSCTAAQQAASLAQHFMPLAQQPSFAAIVVVQDWYHVQVRSAGWLIVATLFGIPLGLLLLTMAAEAIMKAILAVVIIGFSTYCFVSRRPIELKDDRLAWFFGFGAGVLGGAYGMNGPPLVIYGALRRWSPEHFRATLQGYFLPASVVGMGGNWLADLWVADVTRYFLLSLPLALAAILLGRVANRRMNSQSFTVYIHCGLIVIGMVLLIQSIWR